MADQENLAELLKDREKEEPQKEFLLEPEPSTYAALIHRYVLAHPALTAYILSLAFLLLLGIVFVQDSSGGRIQDSKGIEAFLQKVYLAIKVFGLLGLVGCILSWIAQLSIRNRKRKPNPENQRKTPPNTHTDDSGIAGP